MDIKIITLLHTTITIVLWFLIQEFSCKQRITTRSIEEMALEYEDDKNSMIAMTPKDGSYLYEDFYDELDNRIRLEDSMDTIFFGPPGSFMRLDAESILHLFSHTQKHLIPNTRTLLAWDIITDGKTAAFLQGREYYAFGDLLNVIAEEDLYYVNFGIPSVLRYFSDTHIKLHKRKYGVLIAAYRRYFGLDWYKNSSYINTLGYLLCGFASTDLSKISPHTFKELNNDALRKLGRCDVNQTKTLFNIATHPDAYGEPYKWTSHEISRLDTLFACIRREDIGSIQLEAIAAISPQVMKSMNQEKLKYFTKQQIFRMQPATRRTYIIRMQLRSSLDMTQLAKHGRTVRKIPSFAYNFVPIIVTLSY